MADKNDNKPQDSNKPRTFWETINPGYLLAGAAALANTGLSINKNFAKNKNEAQIDKELHDVWKELRPSINKPVEPSVLQEAIGKLRQSAKDLYHSDKGHEFDKVLYQTQEQLNAARGEGGIMNKALKLRNYQKWQVAFSVVTVGSVALGALYSFTRERHLAERLHTQAANHTKQLTEQLKQNQQGPQTQSR